MEAAETKKGRFLRSLRRSRLLSDEEIDPFVEQRNLHDADDATIAREFLKAQLLTTFQAKYILHARWRGLVIGDYTIREPISSGGMGEVYLASRKNYDEHVAIKILRTEFREVPRNVERFRLEAYAVMTLNHPNLLRGIEYDTIADTKRETHYIATEFVRGPNLYELTVIRRQLPWQQAADLIMQAAEGMHYAHEQGFVHRDIKPGNIIISSSGSVKVIDFGLAQFEGPDNTFRFSLKKRRGTERYAAPEQTVTKYPIGPHSDVYALGCTLYFALCGRPPSGASSNLYPSSRTALERLAGHRDDLPDELIQIIQKMLHRTPDRRYESADAVAEALRPFSQRMGVEVNYPALLRARDKARKSDVSWDTVAKFGTATNDSFSQNEPVQQFRSDAEPTGTSQPLDSQEAPRDQPSLFDGQNEAADAEDIGKLEEVYGQHRKHVDRLHERIETLESELKASRENEKELRTELNAKEAERTQVASERDQAVGSLQTELDAARSSEAKLVSEWDTESASYKSKIGELSQSLNVMSTQLADLEESKRSSESEHEQRLNRRNTQIIDLSTQIESLQSDLVESNSQRESLEESFEKQQNAQKSLHNRFLRELHGRLASAQSMYETEKAKRLRTSKVAADFYAKISSLKNQLEHLASAHDSTSQNLQSESARRRQAEAMAKSYADRLNSVVRRADLLSSEIHSFFNQLTSEQAEAAFFDNYEEACDQQSETPSPNESSIGNLLANPEFIRDLVKGGAEERDQSEAPDQ